MSKKPLEILNLSKNYGSFSAVKNVSFDLKPGEIFGLLGPNGAGKTTLISCIVTLEKMTSGQIKVMGEDVYGSPKFTKTQVGYVPQEVINHGYFTVREILEFYSGYFGIFGNDKRIDYLLERLALAPHKDKKVKQLSGGMKRRLMIAKALVHKPKLLLLDEPTAGVDIELRNALWEFVEDLRDSGTTVLLTTHYLEEAESLCDRVGVIHQGEIKKIGDTKALISELTFRKLIVETKDQLNLKGSAYIKEQKEKTLVLEFPASLRVGEVLNSVGLDLSQLVDMQLKEGSLEEAFLKILKKGEGALS